MKLYCVRHLSFPVLKRLTKLNCWKRSHITLAINESTDVFIVILNISLNTGFEVLTAVTVRSSVFLDITECIPVKFNQIFWGTVSSIFTIEEYAKQDTGLKQATSRGEVHGTPSTKAWNLLWFCYCFITSRQWLSLFPCLVPTWYWEWQSYTSVSCDVRIECLNLTTVLSVGIPQRGLCSQKAAAKSQCYWDVVCSLEHRNHWR
jgi:hypothetical protein